MTAFDKVTDKVNDKGVNRPRLRYDSPTSVLIRRHYEEIGLPEWDNHRVHRLCNWLCVTPHELGTLAAVSNSEMSRYMGQNKFPGPVALHFALIESWYKSEVLRCDEEPVVPMGMLAPASNAQCPMTNDQCPRADMEVVA